MMLAEFQTVPSNSLQIVKSSIKSETFYAKVTDYQNIVDSFLDYILDFKKSIKERTENIADITLSIESISWDEHNSSEELKEINEIYSSGKELASLAKRFYAKINNKFGKKRIATDEIKDFKIAIDDFSDAIDDLYFAFNYAPISEEFQNATSRLLNL